MADEAADARWGAVLLRQFTDEDVELAMELSQDPYVPQIGTLA